MPLTCMLTLYCADGPALGLRHGDPAVEGGLDQTEGPRCHQRAQQDTHHQLSSPGNTKG